MTPQDVHWQKPTDAQYTGWDPQAMMTRRREEEQGETERVPGGT